MDGVNNAAVSWYNTLEGYRLILNQTVETGEFPLHARCVESIEDDIMFIDGDDYEPASEEPGLAGTMIGDDPVTEPVVAEPETPVEEPVIEESSKEPVIEEPVVEPSSEEELSEEESFEEESSEEESSEVKKSESKPEKPVAQSKPAASTVKPSADPADSK